MALKPSDSSHSRLIEAVEDVDEETLSHQRGNPASLEALAIKIMTRHQSGMPIPEA